MKTIKIREKTHRRLSILKARIGCDSFSDLFDKMKLLDNDDKEVGMFG